jgi:acetate kinase
MEYFGIEFDAKLNDGLRGKDAIISKKSSEVTLMTITTNEELVIALDTMKLVGA